MGLGLSLKQNLSFIGGNVSFVDIKESTQKPGEFFGNMSIAYDDGYFDRNNNNQWVERVSFIDIKVTNRFLKLCKNTINPGDQIAIEGKLVVDTWQESGNNRKAMKIQAEKLVGHTTKQEIECLKAAGLLGGQPQS